MRGGREKKDEVSNQRGGKEGKRRKETKGTREEERQDVKGKYGGKRGIRRGLNKDVVREGEKERGYELRKWGRVGR